MSRIEEELRATFARHEASTPASGPVRQKIDFAWVRAKRRRAWRRTAGVAAAVVLAGAATPLVIDNLQHREGGPVLPAAVDPAGPLDVLLLGSDRREGREPGTSLADTVMLLHLTADRKQVYLISLPRGGVLPGGEKLNWTLMRGASATRDAVEGLTGVELDATVTVELRALRAVSAAVGDVTMCVRPGIVAHPGRKAIPAGCHDIGPDEVEPLLRGRWKLPNGSYDRDHNNRAYLRLLAGEAMAGGISLSELQALLTSAGKGLRVDGDELTLLRVAASLDEPELVGIGAKKSARREGSRDEAIYPGVGPGLYAAIRDDRLAEWAAANPDYVDQR
ncbi:LCP family protein [Actinoplanes sp. NPDC023801]|uniref:LCP family protein n=1 Tax=Actinoplanes sp. NPDC023801 TaxID=3154595 RepID=UPI0033D18ACA